MFTVISFYCNSLAGDFPTFLRATICLLENPHLFRFFEAKRLQIYAFSRRHFYEEKFNDIGGTQRKK